MDITTITDELFRHDETQQQNEISELNEQSTLALGKCE